MQLVAHYSVSDSVCLSLRLRAAGRVAAAAALPRPLARPQQLRLPAAAATNGGNWRYASGTEREEAEQRIIRWSNNS